MCGICGYYGKKAIDEAILWQMNNTMYHRGPNDGGIWQNQGEDYAIGMAQRRLSILDLSELGHQPMFTNDGRFCIVYNGEIYNYQTLKKQLQEKGYTFKSNCDTEVILYAFAEWGNACFAMLNGMFAIAIYDKESKKLTLARDRVGKKPLYYYHENGNFVFASELKPIMQYPYFPKTINRDIITNYLCNKYLPAPLCIFENTYKMVPGTYLEFEKGQVSITTYWDIQKAYQEKHDCMQDDFKQCKSNVDQIIKDAVRERLVADVPVGTFLSGGIDSTIVTAIAQRESNSPVNTFSIGFYDKERNEAPYSAEIAKYLGTNHHENYVTEEDILALTSDLPTYYDEPFSDSSQLPTMLVSKYASQEITVALSGDGGDEIFCGYKMYDWTWIAQHFDWAGAIADHMPGKKLWESNIPSEFRAMINNRNQDTKTQLYIDVMVEEADKLLGREHSLVKFPQEKTLKMPNWQERRMLLDMQTYLPDEVLAKTDRASMKYSLEVRCPLLDFRLIEESFSIPHQYKYHKFDKKYILKQLTYDYVPEKLLDRPKKGFGVPLRKWLRGVLKKEITCFADETILKRQDIFQPEAVQQLIQKQEKSDKIVYSSLLWSFYVFQLWYQKYIEDLWSN